MVKKCFVPGCKSGSYKERKKIKESGLKNPSFFKPRDVEMLEQWRNVVKDGEKMQMSDFICSLHFTAEDIITHFSEKLGENKMIAFERRNPTLRTNAVPSKHLGKEGTDSAIEESDDVMPDQELASDFVFDNLIANLEGIIKPTLAWSVSHIVDGFSPYVVCTKWKDLNCDKRVIIDKELNIIVFFKDREICRSIEKINGIDDISNLLMLVDSSMIFSGIDDK